MGRPMGMDFGLPQSFSGNSKACKRQNRWLFKIEGVSATLNSLPPLKGARPSVSFKEMEVKHFTETIMYPQRPEWKPINLTLYDTKVGSTHPVYEWMKKMYDVKNDAKWTPIVQSDILKDCDLELYDGCGKTIEKWVFEQAWPSNIEWGELDMGKTEILTCDITLRYARAYWEEIPSPESDAENPNLVSDF